jgi:hypothetical protein
VIRISSVHIVLFILWFQFPWSYLAGQGQLRDAELKLLQISRMISDARSDTAILEWNRVLSVTLTDILKDPGSFYYPFDSLTFLSKIRSPDEKFRIYTWEVPGPERNYLCFGLLQMSGKSKTAPCRIFELSDKSNSIPDPQYQVTDTGHWFGAMYYQLITSRMPDGSTLYTLLGRNRVHPVISRKVIEILTFPDEVSPTFGAAVFPENGNGLMKRIIFQYGSNVSMVLRYESQVLLQEKKWNPSKRSFNIKESSAPMIVYDHLVPLDPALEGMYEYYIPASDLHNGFLFSKDHWNFIEDIEARNK